MPSSDLFKPLPLLHGPAMRNRFMLAPLTNQQSDPGGFVSWYDLEWMRQLAHGGYGLITTCAAQVEAGGIAFAGQLGIHDDAQLPGLREMASTIRRACGPDFQIGWRLSVERYGLILDELRELTGEILRRELIDYLDLALWDSRQIVDEGTSRGKSMLRVFTELPRGGVRIGAAGKIYTAERCVELLDEGCDFVIIGRAGILERDFPMRVKADPRHRSPEFSVTADFLRAGGLSERFVTHLRGWSYFLDPTSS